VDRGVTYTIQIRNLPCCVGDPGDELDVKVSEGEEWGPETDFQTVKIKSDYDGKYVEFTWTVPEDAPICKTRVVLFRAHKENGWPESVCKGVYVTQGVLTEKPAHLHVIPEFAFGTALSIISLLSGLMVYSKFRRN